MDVFITGGTGLLGINTIIELLARGHTVTAVVRDRDKAHRVLPQSRHIRLVDGDMKNPATWLPELRGADALVHCAAYFREYFVAGDHAPILQTMNVELPVRLAQVASDFGVKKTVIVSSSGVVAPSRDGTATDETVPPRTAIPENAYFVSKVDMEEALTQIAPAVKNTLIIVRPGWMFAPNDYSPTGAGELVLQLLKTGAVQLVGGTPTNIADARDVATGIVSALETVTRNEIYNLAGNPHNGADALRVVAEQAGSGRVQEIPDSRRSVFKYDFRTVFSPTESA